MRYALNDREWAVIKSMLPNKPRGVPRVNDRRVLNGIFWVVPSGALGVMAAEGYAKLQFRWDEGLSLKRNPTVADSEEGFQC